MHGVLVLDKPPGMSSASAVEHVKRALGASRAGHGGTLDPLATGVLPICLEAATKLAPYLLADDKAYEAEGRLGITTDTLDRGGRVLREQAVAVDEAALRAAIGKRVGAQAQVPPMYSAIKQGGKRLYHLARAGEEVERAPRQIRIDVLELIAFEPPKFKLRIACSKGTYVRSIVADLGDDVGCGAHLTELRRTRSGRFTIEQAIPLAAVGPSSPIIPLAEVTGLPSITVPEALRKHALSGVQFSKETWGELPEAERYQLVGENGTLMGIVHFDAGKTIYDRVFPEVQAA